MLTLRIPFDFIFLIIIILISTGKFNKLVKTNEQTNKVIFLISQVSLILCEIIMLSFIWYFDYNDTILVGLQAILVSFSLILLTNFRTVYLCGVMIIVKLIQIIYSFFAQFKSKPISVGQSINPPPDLSIPPLSDQIPPKIKSFKNKKRITKKQSSDSNIPPKIQTITPSQSALVNNLVKQRIIKRKKIINVLKKVDRADFTDKNPYDDRPKSIGYEVTISAPHIHAQALKQLYNNLKPGSHVLDVGSGSGYLLPCFAYLVGNTGKVVGIERHQGLVDKSKENISKSHKQLLDSELITIVQGDGKNGYPRYAPYNAIHVGATAEKTPTSLLKQLKKGGKLLIPVKTIGDKQVLRLYTKTLQNKIVFKDLMGVRYVPLV